MPRATSQNARAASGHASVSNIAGDKGMPFFACLQIINGQQESASSAMPNRLQAKICQCLRFISPNRPESSAPLLNRISSYRRGDHAVMAITKSRIALYQIEKLVVGAPLPTTLSASG